MRTLDSPLVEDSPAPATPDLLRCLSRVEYYQPLYGISGLKDALRPCRDRALAMADALAHIGNNFRLIDFGSSLGYFPFFFADRGAIATGFDIRPENTAVALATQRRNGLPAAFQTAALDLNTVRSISAGEYDVAVILSVLHHIVHQRGIEYVAQLVAEILERIPNLILELAHRDEDVPFAWRASQPQEPLAILGKCRDVQVRCLGYFPSHLSSSTRPMYLITR